jgi:hypothetical protein
MNGRPGSPNTGCLKSNALVRSPQTLRRHALMFWHCAGLPIAVVHF